MKKICIIICCSLVLLNACQYDIHKDFVAQEKPTDWIGESPVTLVNAWGKPTQIINNGDYQYLIYMSAENLAFGTDEGETNVGELQMIDGYPQATPQGRLFCQTTFVVYQGKITKALWQGDGCGINE